MGYGSWFRRRSARQQGGQTAGGRARNLGLVKSSYGRRARLEELEDRRLLATFLVTNTLDTRNVDGEQVAWPGSLRAAVEAANGNDNNDQEVDLILFADGLRGTIGLTNGQLDIEEQVRILGPGPSLIGVQASFNNRIFHTNINDDDDIRTVEISGLTLTGGQRTGGEVDDRRGGAILNRENLTMREVVFDGNSASEGGGAIYHLFGNLQISRSLLMNNSGGGIGGGAILVGDDETVDNRPRGRIIDSTITGNSATSTADEQGYGGGILVRQGRFEILNNTIYQNFAGVHGAGVASWGSVPADPPSEENPEPEAPPATVETTIQSNIIYSNELPSDDPEMPVFEDIAIVGADVTQMDGDMEIQTPLESSITNLGNNDIGVAEMRVEPGPDDISDDPMLSDLGNFGGSTQVFLPLNGSPVIDAGVANSLFEQRGRHFVREFNDQADIGAAEVQSGVFVVDIIADESDGQWSDVALGGDPYTSGDFAIREALLFSFLNPEVDSIEFSDGLRSFPDPNPLTPAPTLLLTMGELVVDASVFINGPNTWLLEIDATGNDPTPLLNNSDGSRIFNITDGLADSLLDVTINDLTVLGGDTDLSGGGILSLENLKLNRMTVKENNASTNGGGIYQRYGDLDIDSLTINNNRAASRGGGIYVEAKFADMQAPTVTIVNATISGNNAADRGGGITNDGSHVLIEHSTIYNNNSGFLRAGGILNAATNLAAGGSHVPLTEVRSSIVAGNPFNANNPNAATQDVEFFFGATITSFVSLGYNFIGGGNAVSRFNATGDKTGTYNPQLDPLAITGGLLATHRPKTGSPIIDMGDPAAVAGQGTTPKFDERGTGFVRVYDGDNNGSTRIDIGSYELQPNMIVVDSAADVNDGNMTPGNVSLREALTLSNLNPIADVIVFDITMLPPTITVDLLTLPVTDSVTIMGPGSGVLAVSANNTTGLQLLDRMFKIDNSAVSLLDVKISGLEFSNGTFGAILSRENLTLDDITFLNNAAPTAGGALFQEKGTFKLLNSLVTGNSTAGLNADGGAIYLLNAPNSQIFYSVIAGNSATMSNSDGGALAIKGSSLTVTATTISGNSTIAGAADGGGVFVESSVVLFEESAISGNLTVGANSEGGGLHVTGATANVTVDKNTAINANQTIGTQSPGGGAYVTGGAVLTFNNALLAQNSTFGNNSSGGAVAVAGGTLVVIGTTMLENRAVALGSNGGAISNVGGNLVLRNSTLARNSTSHAASLGGGIYTDTNLAGTQTTTILNSTISGNTAPQRGGGIFNADGRLDIKHSTITENSTGFFNAGSGVASAGNASTVTTVQGSIIAGNVGAAAGTGSDLDFIGSPFINSIQSLGYNVVGIGNAIPAFNKTGDKINITNPLLAPLDFNGGLTPTHALLTGSPAINAGNPSFNPNAFTPALATDQRGDGFARVKGGRIDVGAFESDISALGSDFDSDGDVDGADFLSWQRGLGTANPTKANGDANGDGVVNGADLTQWRGQFGASAIEAAFAPAAVSGVDPDDAPASAPSVQLVAESAEAAASGQPASGAADNLSSVAGAGTPSVVASSRGHRPAVRSAAPQATAQAVHAAAFDALASGDDGFSPSARSRFVAADADAEDDLSGEDALFALIGDAAL